MLVGFPAAGKTTYARKLLGDSPTFVRVSSDDLINMTGQDYSPVRQHAIREAEEAFIRRALLEGLTVIVDRTNLSARERARWIALAKDEGVESRCVVVQSDDWRRRNEARTDETRVPHEAVLRMMARWETPEEEEGLTTIETVES